MTASISPDGRTLLAVGDTNQIFLNNVTASDDVTFRKVATYEGMGNRSLTCDNADISPRVAGTDANFSSAWSADGRKFAVACQDGQVTVWDVRSSKGAVDSRVHNRSLGTNTWIVLDTVLGVLQTDSDTTKASSSSCEATI